MSHRAACWSKIATGRASARWRSKKGVSALQDKLRKEKDSLRDFKASEECAAIETGEIDCPTATRDMEAELERLRSAEKGSRKRPAKALETLEVETESLRLVTIAAFANSVFSSLEVEIP